MTGMLIAVMLMAAPAQQGEIPAAVQKYLEACEAARKELIVTIEKTIRAKDASAAQSPDVARTLKRAREQLAELKSQPAPLVPLSMPPQKDDVGVFAERKIDNRRGKFVDVMEVVDGHSAVIRVWYTPGGGGKTPAKDPVPMDFWAQGIDTSGMKNHSQAELPQAFQALGNKGLPTDCGARNIMVLVPVDLERFRAGAK